MLRITPERGDGRLTLKLEGSLAGPWVEELERAVDRYLPQEGQLRLDLSEVHYADADGATLLHDLLRGKVEFGRRSTFIAELLEGGNG